MHVPLSKEEKTWGMICHLSAFAFFVFPFGHILGPLIVWLIKKDQYEFVNEQGKEALNFQISITIYAIIAGILVIVLIGIALLVVLVILDIVLVIMASIKANEGIGYRYPFSIRVIT